MLLYQHEYWSLKLIEGEFVLCFQDEIYRKLHGCSCIADAINRTPPIVRMAPHFARIAYEALDNSESLGGTNHWFYKFERAGLYKSSRLYVSTQKWDANKYLKNN